MLAGLESLGLGVQPRLALGSGFLSRLQRCCGVAERVREEKCRKERPMGVVRARVLLHLPGRDGRGRHEAASEVGRRWRMSKPVGTWWQPGSGWKACLEGMGRIGEVKRSGKEERRETKGCGPASEQWVGQRRMGGRSAGPVPDSGLPARAARAPGHGTPRIPPAAQTASSHHPAPPTAQLPKTPLHPSTLTPSGQAPIHRRSAATAAAGARAK
jgi:hypothetical protein